MEAPEIQNGIVEIKSQSPDLYDTWDETLWRTDGLWRKYAWQVSVYMYAASLDAAPFVPCHVVRVRRPDENGSPYQFSVHLITRPFHLRDAINWRARHLDTIAKHGELPACDTAMTWGCPFWQLHEDTRETVSDSELDEAARAYDDASLCVKKCEGEKKLAKERLVKILGDRTDVVTGGGWSVKYTAFEKREYVVAARTETRLTVKKL